MSAFSSAVERAMESAGISTWYRLGKMADIKISTIYKYRDGSVAQPGYQHAVAIAKVLGTTVEALTAPEQNHNEKEAA